MKAWLPTYGNQIAKEVRMNRQQQARQKARLPAHKQLRSKYPEIESAS
jgi:hypothetical protein